MAVSTISDINRLINTISLYTLLEIDVNSGVTFEDKHLIGFANYLDYQWVGAGKTAYIYPSKIATFIAEKLKAGTAPEAMGSLIIDAFENGDFSVEIDPESTTEDELRMRVGAYMVGEFEFHQEPDGEFLPLMEINQAKLFFSGHFDDNHDGVNGVDFLAEFNPIPEEVIHHIETVFLFHEGHLDTITAPEGPTDGETIPFERLSFSITNVAKSGINATFGQIRNPFGIWSDFTSHRNFATTKSSRLVNGFALKKIELGLQLDRKFGPVTVTGAIVHGRLARTTPLFRADGDSKFDGLLRLAFQRRGTRLGLSSYFADMGTQRMAIGADFSMEAGKFLLGGELVYQRNQRFGEQVGLDDIASEASSVSAYFQADYAIAPKLHVYGLYEVWTFMLDNEVVHHPVFRTFHGVRYYLLKNVRWTIAEGGYMHHRGFDSGQLHLSTQVEVSF